MLDVKGNEIVINIQTIEMTGDHFSFIQWKKVLLISLFLCHFSIFFYVCCVCVCVCAQGKPPEACVINTFCQGASFDVSHCL